MATVSQNRIVSTVRGSEVVSDPTNALAVEAAVGVKPNGPVASTSRPATAPSGLKRGTDLDCSRTFDYSHAGLMRHAGNGRNTRLAAASRWRRGGSPSGWGSAYRARDTRASA
jgi:hypothetical protein